MNNDIELKKENILLKILKIILLINLYLYHLIKEMLLNF